MLFGSVLSLGNTADVFHALLLKNTLCASTAMKDIGMVNELSYCDVSVLRFHYT